MCACDPRKRTPFCGKPGCEWPEPDPKTVRLDGDLAALASEMFNSLQGSMAPELKAKLVGQEALVREVLLALAPWVYSRDHKARSETTTQVGDKASFLDALGQIR